MASAFDDMVANDVTGFMGVFGEMARLNVVTGGVPRTINGIVLRDTRRPVEVGNLSNRYNAMNIYISSVDDVDGIVSPKEVRDGVTADVYPSIDGETWICQRVLERNMGGMHYLELWDGGS